MASPAGLEPATLCLEGRCSIQLSYGLALYCDSNSLRDILVLSIWVDRVGFLIAVTQQYPAPKLRRKIAHNIAVGHSSMRFFPQALLSSSPSFVKTLLSSSPSFLKPFFRQALLSSAPFLHLPFNTVYASRHIIDTRILTAFLLCRQRLHQRSALCRISPDARKYRSTHPPAYFPCAPTLSLTAQYI